MATKAKTTDAKDIVKEVEPEPEKVKTPQEIFEEDLQENIKLLRRTTETEETRFVSRVLRSLTSLRKRLDKATLASSISSNFTNETEKEALLSFLGEAVPMAVDNEEAEELKTSVEAESFLHLLCVLHAIDSKQLDKAMLLSNSLIEKVRTNAKETLNLISAKAYFYYARSHELAKQLDEKRDILLAAYRTATLRHDDEGQITLLNILLRSYLSSNQYNFANKLLSRTQKIKERTSKLSNPQVARYLFYQGKIKAIQLEYFAAEQCLSETIRKAPSNTAKGFRLAANKLTCIVQLLMGEIPERSLFTQPDLAEGLSTYLQLTRTVRVGDLNGFRTLLAKNTTLFTKDGTLNLIKRLHHNVLKAALKKINIAYYRISLADICKKLKLESVEDTEYIVAKAIKDGVIEAFIDHAGGFMQSKQSLNVYSTSEPTEAFHQRTTFCLNLHNEAVKAMRYPDEPDFGDADSDEEEEEEDESKETEETEKKDTKTGDKKNKKNDK